MLGPCKYEINEASERVSSPGTAAGLVWTSVGGGVQYIECVRVSSGSPSRSGTVKITGQVGDVLEESVQIALSWIRAHSFELGLEPVVVADTAVSSSAEAGIDSHALDVASSPEAPLCGDAGGAVPLLGMIRRDRLSDSSKYQQTSSATARWAVAQHVGSSSMGMSGTNQGHGGGHVSMEETSEVVPLPGGRYGYVHNNVMMPFSAHGSPSKAGISPPRHWDVHVHLPAGAVPKDGPSAGITLLVALVSLMSGRMPRSDTAMTGELTLRGLVLPVGGIKEKLLAARAAGITRVIVPARNMPDVLSEAGAALKDGRLQVIPAARVDQVLAAAFDPPYVLLPTPRL